MDNVFNPFTYDIMDEYYDIWKSLCMPSGTKFCKLIDNKTQTNDLFLIRHDKLYNGKLNKQQIINYINCNNIHFIDKIYMTHLMCACIYSQYDSNLFLVKLLLKRNIDIECTDNTYCSALSYSLKNPGNVKIIRLLLKNIPKNNMEIINDAFIYWSKTDYSPNISIGKLLIDVGININYLDIYGRSALFNIINNKKSNNIVDIVKFLLLNGSDINIIISTKPFSNWLDKSYDLMDYAIERYKWNSDKKIISILYDFGYHQLPNTNDDHIINFSQKIVENINLSKTYFKTIEQDLKLRRDEIIYKPGSLRYNIIKSNWNLTNNILKSNDVDIFSYYKIYNKNELENIINEIY
ncbi:ankyrin repeat protein [Megavirus chiliensis]|uniref:Ankyrin repeat protein n=2 Tax=Megamimivirinae TaxID=3044648 RepID=A0A2L2DNZ5_MIMIV|nr:putative ankyrin repeat protein [Megavirus chiliensis]AEQ33415.1 ankyrin repeat protein [Megavirus chiliensis]AVG47874.1 ankyrin repeat protein [Acanthamoeba polyphaga mimivirus]